MLRSYDALPELRKTDLASLGIGRTEATQLRTFVEKFGKTEDGIFDPHLEHWDAEPSGAEAARIYRIAIQRDMSRSIPTLGIGDTPRIMGKWYGKLGLQFQAFAFKFMNGYMRPLVQRGVHFKDKQAATSFAMLMAATGLTIAVKDALRGDDPSARYSPENWDKTATEYIDRAGLLGWMSPYVQSGLKLSGFNATTRYQRQNWAEPMLGVSAGLFGDIERFGASAASGEDADKVIKKGLVLAPFGNFLRAFYHLYETP